MNATLRCGFILLGVCASVAAGAPEVRVAASRGLNVAVVDAAKPSPARDALHQTFAASLGAAVSARCGGTVGVRATCVGADYAAFNLGTGVYDAVFVLGRDVPEALRRVDGLTLSASPDSGRRERTLHLIVGNGDAALQGLLAAGFAAAINDGRFLAAFSDDGRKLAATGAKVAASP